ncbi:hypothetical protein P8452_05692 [Trifolium repens]|nr:hypothetical protein P8452_05692 [Trifolium repens]
MKLLEWMHRKLRQNSTEPFKDLVTGKTAVDEEQIYHYYLKPNFGSCKHVKQTHKAQFKLRKSFEAVGSGRSVVDEEEEQEAWGGIFPGFLAIGTLGLESDPSSTPTFSISVENIITEKEDEVTENELKLINDELEKVLVLTNNNDDSSGRNSHVSTGGRSSHGSSSIESNTICPLQEYLFGCAVELSETTTTTVSVSKNKEQQQHSHRTTLAELFHRSKLADQDNLVGAKDDTDKDKEEANKSAMHLMRKKLKKKRMLHASSQTSVDSASADRKLHNKILQMFHRKVHPENPTAAEKYEKKRMNGRGQKKSQKVGEEDIMIQPKRAVAKERQLQFSLGSGSEDSSENKEQWIKTDADYLVLEL